MVATGRCDGGRGCGAGRAGPHRGVKDDTAHPAPVGAGVVLHAWPEVAAG